MAQANLGAYAAATKIQATVRGNQDRKRVSSHVSNMIEAMMAGKEPPPFPLKVQPKLANGTLKPLSKDTLYTSVDDHSDVDETSVEEQVIVVLDDSYTDHTRDEVLAEFVTYSEEPPKKPLPSPPRKKSAFEVYNEQLKASVAKPKKAPPSKPIPKVIEEAPGVVEPGDTEDPPINEGWRGKLKKKLSWKSSKPKPGDASAPQKTSSEEKPEASPVVYPDGCSTKEKVSAFGSNTAVVPNLDASTSTVSQEVTEYDEENEKVPASPATAQSVKSPRTRSKSARLPTWPPTAPADIAEPSPGDKEKFKRSPVPIPKWVKKTELPAAPDLGMPSEEDESKPAEPSVEKPVVKRTAIALPKWLKPAPLEETLDSTDEKEVKPAPAPRRWKKPVAKDTSPPVESSEILGSIPATTSEKSDTNTASPPAESSEALQAIAPQESAKVDVNTSEQTAPLVDHSSDHKRNKIGIPWLKPKPESSDREPSERELSPPPPARSRSPRVGKSMLVNRYLSKVSKSDPTEEERMAAIEADRARGRWDGKGYVREGIGGEDGKNQRKNWKFLQPKEKEEKVDEGAVIKLQARVRGFLARRRVAKYVDSLIAEMMSKLNAAQEEEDARRREKEEDERRIRDEEEFRLWQEREEERRKHEEEQIRLRMFDQKYGLPYWWMDTTPHKTMEDKEYESIVKKDNGATSIDYKMPPRKPRSLDAVTEEESGIDDENDANLDMIIGNSADLPVIDTTKIAKPKIAKPKRKKSLFSCMGIDGVEEAERADGISYENKPTPALNVALDDKADDGKEDTESEPEPQQDSAPPVVTKLWM